MILYLLPIIVTDDCRCGELMRETNSGYLVKYVEDNLAWNNAIRQVE